MSDKRCPFCGKQTSAAAANCRRCGARLQDVLLASDDPTRIHPPAAHSAAARTMFPGVMAAFVFLYGVLQVGPHPTIVPARPKPVLAASRLPIYRTTAEALYSHYDAYEAAIESTPGTSSLEISGVVKTVSHNMFGETDIELDAGVEAGVVMVTLDHRPASEERKLERGGRINVLCEDMSRILDKPIGQSCKVI